MPDLRDKLQTTLGAKYRIVRELTGGGMSRVFLAQDEQLQREVVVKLLSPDLLDDARVERFRQEVLQTARLQHPTIIPVIDVGAVEGVGGHRVPFYIMPYARGESLRSRMHHEGQLSLSLSMRVLRSVFDALAYAHAHGVVHRDIKPENIFLSGTNALLADFGIAKAIAGPGSQAGVTSPGMAVGTPTYMAPEQIIDGDYVGPRADLFATGVVAYEMLSGKLPWGTQTPVETLKSQAHGRVTPLRSLRPDVSSEMAAVIEACLAWEPEKRPESAAVVLHLLESVGVQPTPNSADAISKAITSARARRGRRFPRLAVVTMVVVVVVTAAAVLARPFIMSSGTRAGYRRLAVLYPELPADTRNRDAVAARLFHMLTATLTPVSGLRLIGLSSVGPWRDRGLPASQIADSLRGIGAEDVLALKVSSASGTSMLALELHSGTGTSNETIAGPFPVGALDQLPPDSLRGFVRMLAMQSLRKLRLGSDNRAVSETQLIEAYMAWLSGRDARDQRTPDGLRRAIGHFERAIALDSAYAGARADLSQTMTLALVYHYRMGLSPFELATRAMKEADLAVMLKPDLADGYLALGLLGVTAGAPYDFIKRAYDEAGRLNSANPDARTWQIGLLGRQLKFDEAAQRAEEEVQLEPGSAGKRTASAIYSLAARDPATAIRNAAEAPANRTGVWIVSQLELWGRLLLNSVASECAAVPAGPYLGARALCLERTGRAAEGRALSDSLVRVVTGRAARDSTFDLALPYGELALYAARHDKRDETLQWLRSAFRESPAGVDYRLMQAGMFAPWAVAFADSLQRVGWYRVIAAARPD